MRHAGLFSVCNQHRLSFLQFGFCSKQRKCYLMTLDRAKLAVNANSWWNRSEKEEIRFQMSLNLQDFPVFWHVSCLTCSSSADFSPAWFYLSSCSFCSPTFKQNLKKKITSIFALTSKESVLTATRAPFQVAFPRILARTGWYYYKLKVACSH